MWLGGAVVNALFVSECVCEGVCLCANCVLEIKIISNC